MGGSVSYGSQQSDNPNSENTVWWCRVLGRVIGAIAGVVSFVLGILVMLSFSGFCILSGILMLINGIIVLVFEIPVVFTFVEFTKPIAAFSEKISQFQRAIIFGMLVYATLRYYNRVGACAIMSSNIFVTILSLIPIFMCPTITTIFGNAPLFACAVLYGLMALGKKADREDMINRANEQQTPTNQTPPQNSSDYNAAANVMESGMKGKLMDNDFQNIANAASQIPR